MWEICVNVKPLSYYSYLSHNKFRKYLTKSGRTYKEKLISMITDYMIDKTMIEGNCKVEIDFYFDNNRKNDLDNFAKPILDAMSALVYCDDCQVVDLHLKKTVIEKTPHFVVRIEKL